jgi:hypothetical protein
MHYLRMLFFGVVVALISSSCSHDFKVSGGKPFSGVDNMVYSDVHINKLKVFVENSGSMDAYLCEGSQFKDAIFDYVSSLNGYVDTTELSYINQDIINYKGSIQNYPSIISFKSGVRKHSDLGEMLESVLRCTDDNTISVFISDCILDVPDGNASDYLCNREIEIKNAFIKHRNKYKNFSVEIIRLLSKYKGSYWYKGELHDFFNGSRPYYMWVMGNQNALAYLNRKVPVSDIKHGIDNYVSFAPCVEPTFSVTDAFGVQSGGVSIIRQDPNSNYKFLVYADLSGTLLSPEDVCNMKFSLKSNSNCSISVRKIDSKKSIFTHSLLVTGNKGLVANKSEVLMLHFMESLPSWVSDYSSDSIVQPGDILKKNNQLKTYGLFYLISGVFDAYKSNDNYAIMNFSISE